jgi:LysR family hydrogen peroxide-inducible transcriptional activator
MIQTPTLRQLEYLVAVADQRSFHRAARACGVSQPGLSAQIQQLESLLELKLLERDRRPVLVTPAGEEILRRARLVLAETQGLVEAAGALQRPLSGTLRFGVIPTIGPYLLPRVLARVRRRHSELRLRLHEAPTEALVAGLVRGELDLLLLALEAPLGDLETEALFRDPFCVALPRGHRLARRRRLREEDLRGEAVLLLDDGHCLREQAMAVCRAHGADELGDFRASSLTTLIEMVRGGAGLTLLPELTLRVVGRHADLAIVPFARPAPFRTVGLAWRTSSGRAAEYALLGDELTPGGG